MARKNRTPEENARREKIRELLLMFAICDRDSKLLPRMPKDRLEVLETLGWNAPKPCESQPPSTYVSASTERSGNRFGSADA